MGLGGRIALLLVATCLCSRVAHAAEPAEDDVGVPVPSNMTMPIQMRAVLERLLPQSPTLRRQCVVIGAASPQVRITIVPVRPVIGGSRARAALVWTRTGDLEGRLEIPLSSDFPELVAHEFEHVLEQIEGLNLRRLSRQRGTGVNEIDGGVFETVRAHDAGVTAAGEVDVEKRLARARRATLAASNADQRTSTGAFDPSHAARR